MILNIVETFGLCIISLLFGSILCAVFGQLLFMIAGRFAQQQLVDGFGIDTFLLLELWIFYIGTHLLIMIRDSIFITKHNPLKMLRKEKTQELPKSKFVLYSFWNRVTCSCIYYFFTCRLFVYSAKCINVGCYHGYHRYVFFI